MPSLRNLDLNLLVLFDAIHRERRLGAAASAVGLSQPAASQALARLRDALGDPLFVRGPRGMEPTAVAERIAPAVRSALNTVSQTLGALSGFDPATSDREFRLGLAELGESFFFPQFLARVMKAAPGVRLRAASGDGGDTQAALARGDIDLAFDFEPPVLPTLRSRRLGVEELVVIARRGHPRVSGSITLDGFLAERHVRLELNEDRRRRLLSMVATEVILHGVACTVAQLVTVPSVVAQTDALGVVPRAVAELAPFVDRLQILAAPMPLFPLQVFASWHESLDSDPGHQWLRSFLTERFWAEPASVCV
jgi:DNA-binding transcriptional LysR family regulator